MTLPALLLTLVGPVSARSQQADTQIGDTSAFSSGGAYVAKMAAALQTHHLLHLIDSATRGMTFEEARRFGASLSARGLGRLSAEMSLKWASLIDIALSRVDPATCGAWARGSSSPDARLSGVASLIATLEGQELDAWIDVSVAAMESELRQAPTIDVDPDSAALEVVSGIISELSSGEKSRFLADLRNLNIIDDTEACWVGRTIVAHITGAPEALKAHRAQLLARMIASEK